MKIALAAFIGLLLFCTCAWAQTKVYEQEVLLPDGKPAVGANVRAIFGTDKKHIWEWEKWRVSQNERGVVTKTNQKGQFRVETQNDNERLLLLAVDAPGCALSFPSVGLGFNTPVKLHADTPIEGKVVDKNGKPVPNAQVIITVVGANSYVPAFIQHPRRIRFPELTTRTSADGTYSIRSARMYGFENEGVMLWAVGKSGEQTLNGGTERFHKENSITIYPDVSIYGRVVDDATSKPLAGAHVEYSGDALGHDPQTTDSEGSFRFEGLVGNIARRLTVTHRDYPNAVLYASTSYQKPDDTHLQNEVILRLRPVVQVSGTVVDENQQPLPLRINVRTSAMWGNTPGWSQGCGASASTFVNDKKFSMMVPVGESKFTVWDEESASEADSAIVPQNFTINIGAEGKRDWKVVVQRQPGFLVHFKYESKSEQWPYFTFYGRSGGAEEKYLGSNERLWFQRAAKWGDTLEIRAVDENRKELLGWTKLTASPEKWPTVIKLPAKAKP